MTSPPRIAESELILNNRGAVYHLDLRPEELAQTIITVGDPDRVAKVSAYFDRVEVKRQHREFVTHTGSLGSKRLSVISTGIGPDNIDIVLNELDALANIDLERRIVKEEHTSLNIIRFGTCGSLQPDVEVDSFIASSFGLGLDNLMHFYATPDMQEEEATILQHFTTQVQAAGPGHEPYINAAGMSLLHRFTEGYHHGITVTCPGFYGPQGRVLRLGLRSPAFIDALTSFKYANHRITNFEMETSAIYGLGKALGHHCLSLSVAVANRVNQNFTKDGDKAVKLLIESSLEKLSS